MTAPGKIDGEADQHPESREGEGDMPVVGLLQRAGHERRDEKAQIDRASIDLEREGAAAILPGIKLAQLRREIAAQGARAQDQKQQRQQDRLLERHAEMRSEE